MVRAAPDADLIEALDAANRYAVLYHADQAKTPEKWAAKIAELVTMLSRGETLHPRRGRRGGGG